MLLLILVAETWSFRGSVGVKLNFNAAGSAMVIALFTGAKL